jgi:hypothetical protein
MQFWVKVKGHIDTNPLRDTSLPWYILTPISTKNLHSFRRCRAEGNFGFKVTWSRSKVTSTRFFHTTHLCPLIHPPTKYQISTKNLQSFRNYRAEGKYYAIWGRGHWVKAKGHIDTNLLRDTPLSPDTSSHQTSTKNLPFVSKIQNGRELLCNFGSRSKVASTLIFRVTHLCPPIHPRTKYQKKSSFVLEIQSGREFRFQGHRVKVKGHIDTIVSHDTPLSPDTSSHQKSSVV